MFNILLERTKCLFFPSLKPLSVTLCHFPQGNPLSVLAALTGPILPSALGMADPTQLPETRLGGRVRKMLFRELPNGVILFMPLQEISRDHLSSADTAGENLELIPE